MSALPVIAPPYNPEAAPFWTAAAAQRLVLPVCDACGHHIWYPRSWCPACEHDRVTWTELGGRGVVYATSVLRKSLGPWADAAPFLVAYVELTEGPRILTNIVVDDPTSVRIGDPVRAVFVPIPDLADDDPPQAILGFEPT